MDKRHIEYCFPHIADSDYFILSPATAEYNCVAWAAGDKGTWWEPDPQNIYYWPPGIPREYTIEAYTKAFKTFGYKLCKETSCEKGYEKVVIYVDSINKPTHAARQLVSGRWTSKLGSLEDVEHGLDAFLGSRYGDIGVIMKRRKKRERQ